MYRLFCNNKMLVCRNFFEHFLDSDFSDDICSSQVFDNTLDIIKKWLENDCKESPEEINEILKSEYLKRTE